MDRKRDLDAACNLKTRVNISDGADFCGLILEDNKIFPCIVRKLNKIAAHRFRYYDHFTEYQESIRNWIQSVEAFGSEVVIGCNAKLYSMPYLETKMCYEIINSTSHINKEQYEATFVQHEERLMIPVRDRETGTLVTIE